MRRGDECSARRGGGERDFDRFVETVDTEDEEADLPEPESLLNLRRFLPRSSSAFFNSSSATPSFLSSGFGVSLASFGCSFGLRSCCVLDGRAT